jgi:multicomponent K+:H+ antiporter subunit F
MMILPMVMPVVLGMLIVALALSAWRLFKGPSVPDRVLALDTLYINTLALLVAWGIWRDASLYFEVALLIGLLGFAGTVVVASRLLRGRVVP